MASLDRTRVQLQRPPELALGLLVAHLHAVGDQGQQALHHELLAHRLGELLLAAPLQGQHAAHLVRAHEAAARLEGRQGGDLARHRLVVHGQAQPPRLLDHQLAVDEALQDLLLQPQLLDHGRVHAVGGHALTLAQELALELAHGDGVAAHRRHHLARATGAHVLEGGDVQDDEGGDHQPQEAEQPLPVTPHEAESHFLLALSAPRGVRRKGGF